MADYEFILIERQGPVLVAKFNRPPRNLMHAPMVAELSQLMTEVEDDDSVRVVILTGAIDGYFIQHYDVAELVQLARLAKSDPNLGRGDLHATHKAYLQIEELSKPVIAAINGMAHGGGFELCLACDFRLMAIGGSVGLPEATIGILPGAGGTQRLPRLIGLSRAMDLILRGQTVDAERAEALGMVNRAVEPGALMEEAMKLANELAAIPARGLAIIKSVMRRGMDVPLYPALRIEEDGFWELIRSGDALERMAPYAEAGQNPA